MSKKTGLGSSASLISSMTATILCIFKTISTGPLDANSKKLVILCGWVSNALAQKKIGSGFDIASSVFGSIVYHKFKQSNIDPLLSAISLHANIKDEIWKSLWSLNTDFEQFKLPDNMHVAMIDVDSGSDTRVMVSKVIEWARTNNPTGNFTFR